MATTPDYAILSAPRISPAGFAAVLAAARSPAAAEASACYGAFTASGVDPAVGLAIFRRESSFGTAGRAVANRSWGNIRGGTGYPTDDKGFRRYASWTVGALDCARLLGVYGRNAIRPGTKTDTVQTLPFVWAPSSDGNAPDAYGDSLASWVGQWAAKYPSGSGATSGTATTTTASSSIRTAQQFLDRIASIGISTDPTHVITPEEAARMATELYGVDPRLIGQTLSGRTVQELADAWVSGQELGTGFLDEVARAIAGVPAALGDVARNLLFLVAILVLVTLGLYLTVRDA